MGCEESVHFSRSPFNSAHLEAWESVCGETLNEWGKPHGFLG